MMPVGILPIGRQLPTFGSAVGPLVDGHPGLQALGGEDVPLLTVGIHNQSDPGRAIRVVLDVRDLGGDAVVVVPLEVDDAVHPLVAAASMPRSDEALVVPAPLLLEGSVRLFSGFLFLSVSSEKSLTEALRRPGLVGL